MPEIAHGSPRSRDVLIVGGGTMGAGIAALMLEAGATVTIVDPSPASRGRLAASRTPAQNLIVAERVPSVCSAELAIEAVPEVLSMKREVVSAIEAAVSPTCTIATNTSSLSIAAIAAAAASPRRVIGMHFFNPVPRSALIEVIVGPETGEEAIATVRRWAGWLGKEQIEVRDSPGFATSRLGLAIGLEAIRMLEEGVASAADIDRGMVLGYRFPMGPLRLTDLVGLDVRLGIAEHLFATLGTRFEPPALLREMVAAGLLGKKAGGGFFEW